ncbi:uncharacterized protein MONBRDRAFT_24125 [Monosiga brevicollis MX1]|uniref:Uncharacterized protein n=1 Tax=Monosiga brevicollis TaxID=81824 RepID=A9UVG3_MONBE|nr:uncharacterized protein MONBRDRAFT_24125 [Monosiga brevicollis MX1]EDQ90393.1 predicted protein [Monosiga brevicollis MX1]|eukprot:XP_001744444.1 hypothetical protein [Monosiga brevicollis MX1]
MGINQWLEATVWHACQAPDQKIECIEYGIIGAGSFLLACIAVVFIIAGIFGDPIRPLRILIFSLVLVECLLVGVRAVFYAHPALAIAQLLLDVQLNFLPIYTYLSYAVRSVGYRNVLAQLIGPAFLLQLVILGGLTVTTAVLNRASTQFCASAIYVTTVGLAVGFYIFCMAWTTSIHMQIRPRLLEVQRTSEGRLYAWCCVIGVSVMVQVGAGIYQANAFSCDFSTLSDSTAATAARLAMWVMQVVWPCTAAIIVTSLEATSSQQAALTRDGYMQLES